MRHLGCKKKRRGGLTSENAINVRSRHGFGFSVVLFLWYNCRNFGRKRLVIEECRAMPKRLIVKRSVVL